MTSFLPGGLNCVSSTTLILGGPVAAGRARELLGRVRVVLARDPGDLILCDAGVLDDPDGATLDFLCRLQLLARRLGRRVVLIDASGNLVDLLDWTGLAEIMPCE